MKKTYLWGGAVRGDGGNRRTQIHAWCAVKIEKQTEGQQNRVPQGLDDACWNRSQILV
jgi:hypothetical protein